MNEGAPVQLQLWRDDPKIREYDLLHISDKWDIRIREKRFTAAEAMEFCRISYPDADFYGFLADDIVLKTPFSEALGEAATPFFIAYPDDSLQGEKLCTHFVCGGELVRALGWWALPGIIHSGIDWVWMLLGYNNPGMLKYMPDVIYEHMHPLVGKAKRDEIYDFAKSKLKDDDKIFQAWMKGPGLIRDVKVLKEIFV
jgi:hypothetical protein